MIRPLILVIIFLRMPADVRFQTSKDVVKTLKAKRAQYKWEMLPMTTGCHERGIGIVDHDMSQARQYEALEDIDISVALLKAGINVPIYKDAFNLYKDGTFTWSASLDLQTKSIERDD